MNMNNRTGSNMQTSVLIVGGGLGAVAAALSCGRMGITAVMVSGDDWIGGQATSQGVPCDEHPWIEYTGSTATYRMYRTRVREYYRSNLSVAPQWLMEPRLNPGGGLVSPVTHDPRISLRVLEDMLIPFCVDGTVTIMRGFTPLEAHVSGDRIREIDFGKFSVSAQYVVDATEDGALLPLTETEYVTGSESAAEHNELHAPVVADPGNQQSISWCAVLGWDPDSRREPVPRPASYSYWKDTTLSPMPGPHLSFSSLDPFTGKPVMSSLFGGGTPGTMDVQGLWAYRRIHRPDLFSDTRRKLDMTVLNWPQIDYWGGAVIDSPDAEYHLQQSRELTLSFINWLQTEAPREDGVGYGYPEIVLRGDVFGTPDGLAREVYTRESRRIKALKTVTETDIGVEARRTMYEGSDEALHASEFADSIGLASYRIDLHPSTGGDSYIDIESYPAQIPLASLIPVRMQNLLAGGKNIGATHLASGMYRVHPAEWNIGEAAGALAAYCVSRNVGPKTLAESSEMTQEFQLMLHDKLGFELEWPPHVRNIPRYVPQFQWIIKEKRKGWRLQ